MVPPTLFTTMSSAPKAALARDTVFAVVMIVCNGLVGLCIFIGGLRYREQDFQVSGANLYLSVLFVLVQIAHAYGLTRLVGELVGRGHSWLDLLRLAGVSALAANLLNNLPAYLAVEPTALDSPARLAALLVGVNAGPLITPWASLATLLWAGRCRAAGLQVSWLRFALLGALLVPLCLLAGTGALALTG